ncbi:TolC family protein [Crocinitomicaceae bacterium]|nr:TolC family protein [Crocinitomicaceae bacterium]
MGILLLTLMLTGCKIPNFIDRTENTAVPENYGVAADSLNSAELHWRDIFVDPNLIAMIDTALSNNQELNMMLQEIKFSQSEILTRKGELLPSVDAQIGSGVEKVGRYTSQGANDANTEIMPGVEFPEALPDFLVAANASWEIDIWRKLRNSRDAATSRYLASLEGRNFMVTQLVAEITETYYELMAADMKLELLKQNLEIQKNALEIVKKQKNAARVTELAVKKFQAEVYKNQSRQYYIEQEIIETENHLNFLLGRFSQPIPRDAKLFNLTIPDTIYAGVPSQLLENRTDIRQAELALKAAKLDVKAAKAEFYPSLRITAGVGFQAFNPKYLINTPQSLLYNVAGDLVAPLINRNAIKAQYAAASSKQIQAIYNYEQKILNGFLEVNNKISEIQNLGQSYEFKEKEVDALTESVAISTSLFASARADYMEVLLTQRDALEAKFELVETKMQQMHALVGMYRSLGGGW